MKKCPFCQADIEDNARFCVFCMSSLQEKQKIEAKIKPKSKWPIFTAIGGAFAAIGGVALVVIVSLLVALILIISLLFLGKSNTDNNSSLSYFSEQIISSNQSNIIGSDEVIIGKDDNQDTKDTATQTEESTDGDDVKGDDKPSHSGTSSTHSSSKESSSSSKDESSSSTQSEVPPPPSKTEAVYIYRDAVATDCYPPGHAVYDVTDVIVITGVSSPSSDGIYVIPEKINGKKVGAIMPSAFNDPAISSTVKKVVIPATVRSIWQNAFSNCYNLTDIYIYSKVVEIYENSFADVSKRNGSLTIHCTRDCRNFEFYYYRNIAGNYGAAYKEWNGGDIG